MNRSEPSASSAAVPAFPSEATAEAERAVAWLRLPAIALLALSQGLQHPNPQQKGFLVTLALYSAWSAGMLAWVHLRPVGQELALAATGGVATDLTGRERAITIVLTICP